MISPDTKDRTWALDRPCPECGVVAGDLDPAQVPAVLRLSDERLHLMVDTDDLLYADRAQDATAVADRYDQQDLVRHLHDVRG